MADLRSVKVPLLERVALEELADQWKVTADVVLTRLIRQAVLREVTGLPTDRAKPGGNEQGRDGALSGCEGAGDTS